MSYINDALHKVQKEKESPYASYGHVLAAQSAKTGTGRKRVLISGFAAVLFLAAGLAVWQNLPDIPETPRARPPVQHPDGAVAEPLAGILAAAIPKTLTESAEPSQTTEPRPLNSEMTSALSKVPVPQIKEKSRTAAIPEPRPHREALPGQVPADAGKLYAQALQAQREGRLEEAEELYKKVIQKEPRHLQALNNLGVVYLKMKRYKWAIIRFNDALTVKRDYADAHYNLACLYAQKNDTKQSIFYLKNAVDSNPEVRQWASQDEDLKNLAGLPEFGNIIKGRDQ